MQCSLGPQVDATLKGPQWLCATMWYCDVINVVKSPKARIWLIWLIWLAISEVWSSIIKIQKGGRYWKMLEVHRLSFPPVLFSSPYSSKTCGWERLGEQAVAGIPATAGISCTICTQQNPQIKSIHHNSRQFMTILHNAWQILPCSKHDSPNCMLLIFRCVFQLQFNFNMLP